MQKSSIERVLRGGADSSPLNKRFTGFTLAEVLITLGIIGVVAALTLPTLIGNYQKKQTVTKLQKAFTVLNQAYRLSYNDLGEADSAELEEITSEEYFEKYWKPYIKYTKVCTSYSDCGYTSNNPFYTLKGDVASYSFMSGNTRVAFYSPDGFLYQVFWKYTDGKPLNLIIVDINGSQKPNVVGKDIFSFTRTKDGFINTLGAGLTDEVVNKSCSVNEGAPNLSASYCAEKIRRDGWEISEDYPW